MTEWQQLFANLDQLFSSVSTLLMDCDGLLEKHGYRTADRPNNFGASPRSYQIDAPTWWYPNWISRMWLRADQGLPESPLLAISVIFQGRVDDDLPKDLTEPVLCAAVWHYTTGTRWDWWMGKAWGYVTDPAARPLGSEVTRTYTGGDANATGTIFALPLSSITDSAALEARVIERLMANAKKRPV